MKRILFVWALLALSLRVLGQGVVQAIVIQVEDGKVYLDATSKKVRKGDILTIREDAGVMIHPVTKAEIKKEGKILADLEIEETYADYSVATAYPEGVLTKIKTGMLAEMPDVEVEKDTFVEETPAIVVQEPTAEVSEADAIVERYLKLLGGLNNTEGSLHSVATFTVTNTKGKTKILKKHIWADYSKKMYFEGTRGTDKKSDNTALALTESKGLYGMRLSGDFGKPGIINLKPKAIAEFWKNIENSMEAGIGLVFDKQYWQRSLGMDAKKFGKECSTIVFQNKNGAKMTGHSQMSVAEA